MKKVVAVILSVVLLLSGVVIAPNEGTVYASDNQSDVLQTTQTSTYYINQTML